MAKFISIFKLIVLVTVALIGLLVYRAWQIEPQIQSIEKLKPISIDYDLAAKHLADSLKIKTISYQEVHKQNNQAFLDFHQYLQDTYPLTHSKLTRHKINQFSLLYHWKASETAKSPTDINKPVLYMAHFDVVPVNPITLRDWTYPPFAGVIADGMIWGMGYFGFHKKFKAYIEVISFDRLVNMANERNKAFFDKLGLPST